MKAITPIFLLALASCVGPIDYQASVDPHGVKMERMRTWGFFGGSESFETAAGTRWTGNRNKSTGQFFQAATAIVGSYAAASAHKSDNALSAVESTNAQKTAAAKTAADAAVAQAAAETAAKSAAYDAALKAGAVPTVGTVVPP